MFSEIAITASTNWFKKAQQLEVTDSDKLKGKSRYYTGYAHDINYREQNKALGHDPNENYSIDEPNMMWIYNNGQIETKPETEISHTHRSTGAWGLTSHLDKLYTGRYSPSEKIITVLSPHEGIRQFKELSRQLQYLLRQKFPIAERIVRYN